MTNLPRSWMRFHSSQPSPIYGENFAVVPARYAKNRYIIRTKGKDGFKSKECRLADAITNSRYTHREHGYSASPAQAERFLKLHEKGWDATYMGTLMEPRQ